MIFIPKYLAIEAFEVSNDITKFSELLVELNIPFGSVTTDKQTVDGKIVNGYTVRSKNDKGSVFVEIGHLIFSKDGILHIIEDTEAFLEMYEESKAYIVQTCKSTNKPLKEISEHNNMQVTPKVHLRKKKKETTMENKKEVNKDNDLLKAREEALLEDSESKVTAVYGDTVASDEKTSDNK